MTKDDLAERIIHAVLLNLMERRGIRQVLIKVEDEDVWAELRATLIDLAQAEIDR